MVQEMIWKLFEKTGRLDIYMNYREMSKVVKE